MKSADVLEMAAVTRVAMISHDDAEKRSLFCAMTGKANVNGHTILSDYVKAGTNGTLAPGGSVASGGRSADASPTALPGRKLFPVGEAGGNVE